MESQAATQSTTDGSRGRMKIRKALLTALGVVLVLVAALFAAPIRFDEGPAWHATVLGVRDGVHDVIMGKPAVLVIGNPSTSSEQARELEKRLASRGLQVRYTGDNTMSDWERKYVAVYWSVVGMVYPLPQT